MQHSQSSVLSAYSPQCVVLMGHRKTIVQCPRLHNALNDHGKTKIRPTIQVVATGLLCQEKITEIRDVSCRQTELGYLPSNRNPVWMKVKNKEKCGLRVS